MANLTLDALTYVGQGVANGIASYIETSAGVATGYRRVTGSVRVPADGKGPSRVQWKLKIPVVASGISGVPDGTVLRFIEGDINLRSSPLSTGAELTNFGDALQDLVATAAFAASVDSLTQPSG